MEEKKQKIKEKGPPENKTVKSAAENESPDYGDALRLMVKNNPNMAWVFNLKGMPAQAEEMPKVSNMEEKNKNNQINNDITESEDSDMPDKKNNEELEKTMNPPEISEEEAAKALEKPKRTRKKKQPEMKEEIAVETAKEPEIIEEVKEEKPAEPVAAPVSEKPDYDFDGLSIEELFAIKEKLDKKILEAVSEIRKENEVRKADFEKIKAILG